MREKVLDVLCAWGLSGLTTVLCRIADARHIFHAIRFRVHLTFARCNATGPGPPDSAESFKIVLATPPAPKPRCPALLGAIQDGVVSRYAAFDVVPVRARSRMIRRWLWEPAVVFLVVVNF